MDKQQIIKNLEWRYATKVFDQSKKLSQEQLDAVKEIIKLTPTSYGLDPYRVLIVSDSEVREKLKQASWGQAQITDSSHLLVFLHKKVITENDITNFITKTAEVRGIDESALEGYKQMMIGDLVNGPRSAQIENWSKNQTYIVLGNILGLLSQLGIDSCPMEGFDPETYAEILNLKNDDYYPSVVLPVGFRSSEDKYSSMKKVRRDLDEIFQEI